MSAHPTSQLSVQELHGIAAIANMAVAIRPLAVIAGDRFICLKNGNRIMLSEITGWGPIKDRPGAFIEVKGDHGSIHVFADDAGPESMSRQVDEFLRALDLAMAKN